MIMNSVRYPLVNCFSMHQCAIEIISKRRGKSLNSMGHGFHSYVKLPEGTSTELFIGTFSRDSKNPYIRWGK